MIQTEPYDDEPDTKSTPNLLNAIQRFACARDVQPQQSFALPDEREAFLRAVLIEIDETVLARELLLKTDISISARIAVSNRRLTSLEVNDVTCDPQMHHQAEPSALAKSYAEKICAIAEASCRVTLEVRTPSKKPQTKGLSCSAISLADAIGMNDFAKVPETSRKGLMSHFKEISSAWIELGPEFEMVQNQGPEAEIGMLERVKQAAIDSDVMPSNSPDFGGSKPNCVLLPIETHKLVAIISAQSKIIIALMLREKQSLVSEMWTRACQDSKV